MAERYRVERYWPGDVVPALVGDYDTFQTATEVRDEHKRTNPDDRVTITPGTDEVEWDDRGVDGKHLVVKSWAHEFGQLFTPRPVKY